ncbi:MAG: hypothetical protein ACE5JH_12705 [Acidobacteriota bacterium]
MARARLDIPGTVLLLLAFPWVMVAPPRSEAAAQEPSRVEPTASESRREAPLSAERVLQLVREGTSPDDLISLLEKQEGGFDLTLEDAVRLRRLGAPARLVLLLARAGSQPPAAPVASQAGAPAARPPARGSLSLRRVLRMQRKGVAADRIASLVASRGLRREPDLAELLEQRARGVPAGVIRALAAGAALPAAGRTEAVASGEPADPPGSRRRARHRHERPLAVGDVIEMLGNDIDPGEIVKIISERGMKAPPTLEEALSLRRAGATDGIMAAINQATAPPPAARAEPEVEEPEREEPAAGPHVPTPASLDRVWVASVPPGTRVFVSRARTPGMDAFDRDYYMGETPLSLDLAPGSYNIAVSKEAGAFEQDLIPAWRTVHDAPETRSLLDDADLTFDPEACCLPGSLSGTVTFRQIGRDQPGTIIGDHFDGLPPYLFDGETMQVLRVREGRITQALKIYRLRKNAGQSRLLVASFIPAEGDPLDPSPVAGLPEGHPYDVYLDTPQLGFLRDPGSVAELAAVLGLDGDHLADTVAMLRHAGKAILHQQVEGGIRLIALALDDYGRLRLLDRTIRPEDPFAAPPQTDDSGKNKKKMASAAPPAPPPLPALERVVVPGLGLPRLVVDNTTAHALGLLFHDGQFYFVPAETRREFIADPGTFDVQVLAPGSSPPGPRGRIHLSYHARYGIAF